MKIVVSAALIFLGFVSSGSFAQDIHIGTGGPSGIYYSVGKSICKLVNRSTDEHGISCDAPESEGSIANIESIRAGTSQFGVVQYDWQFHAVHGTSAFENKGEFTELRSLFSLHSEVFTVVARDDSGVNSFSDLRGKRVNLGNRGSGQRGTMDILMQSLGWSVSDFSFAGAYESKDQADALINDEVDAIVFTVGHPNASIQQATSQINADIVPVDDHILASITGVDSFYIRSVVPAGMYKGNDTDVPTFGMKATLVSSASVSDETVYELVKSIFDNFARFQGQHPAFVQLVAHEMATDKMPAPYHPGALRYYKERGWQS